MLRYKRLCMYVLLLAVAFGAGLQTAGAQPTNNWCLEACGTGCEGHDGCDSWQPSGCNCNYVCNDGEPGSEICTF